MKQPTEYKADYGDRCDHCGVEITEEQPLWGFEGARVRYWYCSPDHALKGPTREHSRKLRFLQTVLGTDP